MRLVLSSRHGFNRIADRSSNYFNFFSFCRVSVYSNVVLDAVIPHNHLQATVCGFANRTTVVTILKPIELVAISITPATSVKLI